MSNDAPPARIAVIWSPEARAYLLTINRETAIQILYCVDRYLGSRNGDVKSSRRRSRVCDSLVAAIVCSSTLKTPRPSRSLASSLAK